MELFNYLYLSDVYDKSRLSGTITTVKITVSHVIGKGVHLHIEA